MNASGIMCGSEPGIKQPTFWMADDLSNPWDTDIHHGFRDCGVEEGILMDLKQILQELVVLTLLYLTDDSTYVAFTTVFGLTNEPEWKIKSGLYSTNMKLEEIFRET